ncbi:hypothetical protein KXX41_007400, partial [Aspergillus fumigatus]
MSVDSCLKWMWTPGDDRGLRGTIVDSGERTWTPPFLRSPDLLVGPNQYGARGLRARH